MPFQSLQALEVIEIMENYLDRVRPPATIRPKLDLGYRIENLSIILFEIRPAWDDPKTILHRDYAKTTYVKSRNRWNIFWMRASGKWNSYQPAPHVKSLKEFLRIVDEDAYGCFKG